MQQKPKARSSDCEERALGLSKKSLQDFFDKLETEHFERVQNAVTESLDISRLSTAVYPI